MSFFSKLTKEFDELKAKFTDDDKPKEAEKPKQSTQDTGTRGASDSYYGGGNPPPQQAPTPSGPPPAEHYGAQPSYHGQQPPTQSPYGAPPAQSPYGAPPVPSPYGAPPGQQYPHSAPPGQAAYGNPSHNQYGTPQGYQQPYGAPQGDYNRGAPPPPFGQPHGAPVCPPGWNAQFDQNSQRWYYVEHATGRTSWEMPSGAAVGGYGAAGNNPAPAGSDAARAAETGKKDGGNKWVSLNF